MAHPNDAPQPLTGYEALQNVPGIDPVLAVVDGHADTLPAEGILVEAKLDVATVDRPGRGVIHVYGYKGNALATASAKDQREEYHSAHLYATLEGYSDYTVAYEEPGYKGATVEPYDRMSESTYTGLSFARTNVVELPSGGRILDENEPTTSLGSTLLRLDAADMERSREWGLNRANINRVTTDPAELDAIITQVAAGMGMSPEEAQVLVETVAAKAKPAPTPEQN